MDIPIIINNRVDGRGIGFVVNGNRRLALWRELYSENPSNFDFSTISCAVLPPDFTEQQEEDLEFDLQIKPVGRLDYDWTNERRSYRRQLDRFEDQDEGWSTLAKRTGKQEGDLKRDMIAFGYATEYLNWIGKPKYWDLIENGLNMLITI